MLTETQQKHLIAELVSLKYQLTKTEENTNIQQNALEEIAELSIIDNHPADMGTELFEREKEQALNTHAVDELKKVENALLAIQDGSYGICEKCGNEIPYNRLEALPYTTVCIEHAIEDEIPSDLPNEDKLLKMANPNTFANRYEDDQRDSIDSFKEIAKSGTSETPSDFVGDHDDYNELYREDEMEID